MGFLEDLLKKNSLDDGTIEDIKEHLRAPIEAALKDHVFDVQPNIKYGGSYKKKTSNKDSCDLDILCYLPPESQIGVEDIYEKAFEALSKAGFFAIKKNSAIKLYGKAGDPQWEMTVDVVPGKECANESGDVYLWCNRTKNRLKTNPETQIGKVIHSDSREVIRLIKLYRTSAKFEFKSFFLEVFAIDVAEGDYPKDATLFEKLLCFCGRYGDIGIKKIYDPANANNDIMGIHSEQEFRTIRQQIKNLYEVLMTNDEDSITAALQGQSINLDDAYYHYAKKHSSLFTAASSQTRTLQITGRIKGKGHEMSGVIDAEKGDYFIFSVPDSWNIKTVEWLVCNSGYEAFTKKQLRGEKYEPSDQGTKYSRQEHAEFYGRHFVIARATTFSGQHLFSRPLFVKIS